MTVRDELQSLIQETASMAVDKGIPLDKLQGTAFSDTSRDAPITALGPFGKATQAITSIPDFVVRFGAQQVTRTLLQFVYQYFAHVESIQYEEAAFEALLADFMAEIQEPRWVTQGLANVRNFASNNLHLNLGDGIAIRGRNFADLASLGFGRPILDRLSEDWSGFGASSFVLVAEHSVPKEPDNILTLDAGVWTKAIRAISALRLLDAGSVSIGPMWVVRKARFNFGIGGIHQYGVSIPGVWHPVCLVRHGGYLFPAHLPRAREA